jgi:dienelactone hydrolase
MTEHVRWPREAWIPLAAGIFWLWRAPEHGLVVFLFSVIPGCLLVGSGLSMLLMPGDRRIAQFAALGGVLGLVFALPDFVVVGPVAGLLLIGASAAGFLAAGAHSVRLEPDYEDVPPLEPSLALSAQVALDEALLGTMSVTLPLPTAGDNDRIAPEISAARGFFESAGWLEKPVDYHQLPPPLEDPHVRRAKVRGIEYEHVSFESGYEPAPEEPGRDRWLSYAPNRLAHAWVVRHSGEPRPWLVCIHGYQMGWPLIDLSAFPPEYFHRRLGLNLCLPVLPLHGRRKIGRRSGDGFVAGDLLDTIHAEAQAMWDIRRLLSWIRSQDAPAVGALGLSLGGYNTALLACLDDALACAIPGVPLTDFTRAMFRHGPPLHLQAVERSGIQEQAMRDIMQVVSPLHLEPKLPRERRYIFGAVADRLVPADQVRDLWRHWERPRIVWYQGAHVTFRAHRAVRDLVREALRESGLTS